MTTLRSSPDTRRRPRIIGAACALLILSACSGTAEDITEANPAIATAAPGTVVTTASTTAETPADAALVLSNALSQYRDGYEFSATTSVNGQIASVQTGRWIDGGTQLTVTSGDGQVEYIITGAGQWARLPDDDWEELEGTSPAGFPLSGLASPISLETTEAIGAVQRVAAVYPASALGLTGDPVEADLVFDSGLLVSVAFAASIDGNTAESMTTLSDLTDTTPIAEPTG